MKVYSRYQAPEEFFSNVFLGMANETGSLDGGKFAVAFRVELGEKSFVLQLCPWKKILIEGRKNRF